MANARPAQMIRLSMGLFISNFLHLNRQTTACATSTEVANRVKNVPMKDNMDSSVFMIDLVQR